MNHDDDFLQQSRQQLDDSIEHLDMATLSRLNQARQAALNNTPAKNRWQHNWLPASITAALSILLLGGWLFSSSPDVNPVAHTPQLDDLELLSSTADLDLLQDLEFINWLVEEQNAG